MEFTSYRGLVMAGYPGWFRAEGDKKECPAIIIFG